MTEKTLYDQIGGCETIEKLVTAFYQRVLNDPLLQPFFEQADVAKLQRMQIAFFSVALGGAEPDTGISLHEAHQGRGIQVKHLTRFTEHLVATLSEIGVQEKDAQEVYQRIGTYADEVLGESGGVDG